MFGEKSVRRVLRRRDPGRQGGRPRRSRHAVQRRPLGARVAPRPVPARGLPLQDRRTALLGQPLSRSTSGSSPSTGPTATSSPSASWRRASGPLGRYGFFGGGRYADDLQNPDDLDRDRFLLQRCRRAGAGRHAASGHGRSSRRARLRHPVRELRAARGRRLPSSAFGTVVGDDQFLDTGLDALPSQREPGYLDPSTMPDPTDPDEDNFDPLTGSGTEGDGVPGGRAARWIAASACS